MPVKATYDYDFPAADRAELFGDDMLVNVMWTGNTTLCSPACFRAPRTIPWADFKAQMIDPWAATDPDYDPGAATDWRVDDDPFTPADGMTLAHTGVVHKGLITFRTRGAP
jgi:phenol/toluene 2-monooxygenase (NADH) P4/A4